MSAAPPSSKLTVTARPVWRIRLARELPRHLLQAAALAGLLASARYAISPPTPKVGRVASAPAALVDRPGEGFASLFARRYLTWDASSPEAHRLALAPYLGADMEVEAGFSPPESGAQRVLWTQVVQAQPLAGGGEAYTVAAQTDVSGLLYLSVPVARLAGGVLALGGYPALVGPPAIAASLPSPHRSEVEDGALATVVSRALRNYLAGASSELAADLSPGARVSVPSTQLALEAIQSLDWSPDGRAVLVTVRARDRRYGRYQLAYRLGVASLAGRWEIGSIQSGSNE
jgi:hypothetical protein